jgi:hypothetical protein
MKQIGRVSRAGRVLRRGYDRNLDELVAIDAR